jgi:hypothetical protein
MPSRLPGTHRFGDELGAGAWAYAGRCTGDESDRAAPHHSRRSDLAPGGAPLMIALRTKKLFKSVLGGGKSGDAIAVKQAGPVAPGDLPKVLQRGCEGAGSGLVAGHRPAQSPQAGFDRRCRTLVPIAEEVGGMRNPAIPLAHVGPQGCRVGQAPCKPGVQAPKVRWHGPLFSTRSRLSVLGLRRSGSGRPEASRGGRPSSVRALRTAAQEPCTTVASPSVRPATCRAMGRTPRTRFLRAFLACRSAA